MKTKYLVGLFACLSIMVTACGSSSSNDDGNTQLKTEDEALDSFCLNFPQSTACQEIQQEADDLGMNDYFGGNDDLYGDSTYGGGTGMCGCNQGEYPTIYGSGNTYSPQCESERYRSYTRDEARYRYTRRQGEESLSYERVHENEIERTGPSNGGDNCYQAAGRRCNLRDPYACQDNSNGYVQGRDVCKEVPGTNYGYCQEQQSGY